MPAAKSNDGFAELSTLSDKNVVQFVTRLIQNFEHGSNPRFTYRNVLADDATDNKSKSVNLISNPVVIPWTVSEEDGAQDVLFLSAHVNATLKIGQLKKTSPLKINVSKFHLTVRRKRVQDTIEDSGVTVDVGPESVHIGGASDGGWDKRSDNLETLRKKLIEDSALPAKETLITKEALKEMLDGWVSVSRFKSEIRENFRTSLGTQVEKNVKSAANLPRFSVDVVL
ncbi:hypothetical protein CUJ91_26445 [Paraburkholderia graminis]|uniref:hypothetical protein n=1 Tax=Paraburkholderia graminis TaxID=60548 RepID=UPI000DEF2559|nr:hypothetical protein [Paraburkholderia graminis]AXF11395.1 hypothetical protein CUJ91_26445 [Paraburkholderia graminis]MDR6471594.1 hypothetical protein [Paraburkholderia graminis]